jgi:hypothetical protein
MTDAQDIIERCTSKFEFWAEVYEMLEKPFELRAPTQEELREFVIRYAEKYK